MSSKNSGLIDETTSTPRVSIDGQKTNNTIGPSLSSEIVKMRLPMDFSKCVSMEAVHAPWIGQRIVGSIRWWKLPWAAFDPKMQGCSSRALSWSLGVFPRCLDYELTLIRVRHPSTNFHHF